MIIQHTRQNKSTKTSSGFPKQNKNKDERYNLDQEETCSAGI